MATYGYGQNKGKREVYTKEEMDAKLTSWKYPQFKNLNVTSGKEQSVTFNIKAQVTDWNYDLYKVTMCLGEANMLTVKEIYVLAGDNEAGNGRVNIAKQSLITDTDYIGTITATNNNNNTVTITFTPTEAGKLKIKIEPSAIWL